MQISENIHNTIDRFPKGYIFTYMDFDIEVNQRDAVIKSLNRLVISGKINKLSKGKYYKPEISTYGTLTPTPNQMVKDLLTKNGKVIGYISGYGAYYELGLTTQVSNIIQIGKNEIRSAFKRGIYKIAFIKQKNKITKENISLLKILDSIKFIKLIPDTSIDDSCIRLTAIIKKLESSELDLLIKLALKYPPATRALLGTLIETSIDKNRVEPLRLSLNPISKYKFTLSLNVFPNLKKWNII